MNIPAFDDCLAAAPVPRYIWLYIHCEDARRNMPPERVLMYRGKFTVVAMEQRHCASAERHKALLQQKVARQARQNHDVIKKVHKINIKRNWYWLMWRKHTARDIQWHTQKRQTLIEYRRDKLYKHNMMVYIRCKLINYCRSLRDALQEHETAMGTRNADEHQSSETDAEHDQSVEDENLD